MKTLLVASALHEALTLLARHPDGARDLRPPEPAPEPEPITHTVTVAPLLPHQMEAQRKRERKWAKNKLNKLRGGIQ